MAPAASVLGFVVHVASLALCVLQVVPPSGSVQVAGEPAAAKMHVPSEASVLGCVVQLEPSPKL